MKKTFTLFFLICIAAGAFAQQTLPIFNDFSLFDGTNIHQAYPGWNEADGETQPVLGSSGWFSSKELFDHAVGINLTNTTSHRDWIISPSFIATETTKMTFTAALTLLHDEPAQGYFGHDDSVSVMVYTPEGEYVTVKSFTNQTALTNYMTIQEVELGQFADQEISIAFYATDGNQPTGVCSFSFDDVLIKNAVAIDAQTVLLASPNMNTCLTENTPASVIIRNDGFETLAGIPVHVKTRGAVIQNRYTFIEDTLAPGEWKIFDIGTLDMSQTGSYEIFASTSVAGDGFAWNNHTDTLLLEKRQPADLPLPIMTFNEFYSGNLTAVYPDWREARGIGVPQVYRDTDWQGDDHPQSRGASVYFVNVGTEDWLVGPTIEATANTYIHFDAAIYCDEYTENMGSDDKLAIMISPDCGTTWQQAGEINHTNNLDTLYHPFAFSLGDFDGQSIKIALYATTGIIMDSESYLFFIDNLTAKETYETDLSIANVISPVNGCAFSDSEILTVKIKNEGLQTVESFDMACSLNGAAMVEESVTQTLEPGETYEHTFATTLDLTQNTVNTIEITVTQNEDLNLSNNTLIHQAVINSFDLSTQGAYFAGFENNEALNEWSVENANSDEQEWIIQTDPQYAYDGNNSYQYFSNGSTTTSNDWLYSPCFYLETGIEYNIEFYYLNRATSYPESLRLNLCSTPSSDAVAQVIEDLGAISNSSFANSNNTFTVATSGTYYFAWEAYGSADQFGMYIDNVKIRQIFETDIAGKQLIVPRIASPTDCAPETATRIEAIVENMGNTDINTFEITTILNGTATSPQTFTKLITPGDTAHVYVNQDIGIEAGVIYNIELVVQTTGDNNATNDTIAQTDFLLDNYLTGFEPNDDNENWTALSLQGVNEWIIMDDVNNAHTGTHYYAVRTDGAGGNTANDDWLFSGCQHLEAGTCYELSFWYRSRYSTENLTVYMGSAATAESMTTELIDLPAIGSNSYEQATILINVETSGAYYIGFHTDGATSGRYYVLIDDVTLEQSQTQPSLDFEHTIMGREVVFNTMADNITAFEWNFGDGQSSDLQSPTHTYAENGTYTVSVIGYSQCGNITRETTIELQYDALTADFTFIENEAQVTFEAQTNADYISWNMGDGMQAIGQSISHTYTNSGNFDVTMTAYSEHDYLQVTKTVTATVGIANAYSQIINLYPNPAENIIHITSTENLVEAAIYDISGKLQSVHNLNKTHNTIDISNFETGTYIVKITTQKDTYPIRMIVK